MGNIILFLKTIATSVLQKKLKGNNFSSNGNNIVRLRMGAGFEEPKTKYFRDLI